MFNCQYIQSVPNGPKHAPKPRARTEFLLKLLNIPITSLYPCGEDLNRHRYGGSQIII